MSQTNESPMKVNTEPQHINLIWEYNDSSFELDIGDAEFLEHYEAVMERLDNAEKALKKDGTPSERVRAYDKMFRDFYDDLLGDGAGDAILGAKCSIINCDNAFESFLAFIDAQNTAINTRRENVAGKYSGNRAQRRSAQYRRG